MDASLLLDDRREERRYGRKRQANLRSINCYIFDKYNFFNVHQGHGLFI